MDDLPIVDNQSRYLFYMRTSHISLKFVQTMLGGVLGVVY